MKFAKMHGAGNDFIIINNLIEHLPVEKLADIAKCLCARRLSIGADGLMVVDAPTGEGDYMMHFFNSDGTSGEMCGNGARCIARYGYENGLAGEVQKIETTAGLVTGWRISERMYRVRLNDPTTIELEHSIELDGKAYECSYVELGCPGIPHAVVRCDELDSTDLDGLREIGRKLRWHSSFPKGANVNFYKLRGENDVLARTFERGVEDFTLACGTGSGSLATVLTLKGFVSGRNVRIAMPGGDLYVTLDVTGESSAENVFLTGPTNIVAEGEVRDEDLSF